MAQRATPSNSQALSPPPAGKRGRTGDTREDAVAKAMAALRRRAVDVVAEIDALEAQRAALLADRARIDALIEAQGGRPPPPSSNPGT